MAKREIVGLGSVWESDPGDDDACGIFRWKVEVKQTPLGLEIFKFPYRGDEGSWYDGWYDLKSKIEFGEQDWSCDDAGKVIGKRLLIACITTGDGRNADWSLSGSASGSGIPGSSAAGTGITVKYTPGYSGQKLAWQTVLQICPGPDNCPDVTVVDTWKSVSDTEYYWGNEVPQSAVNESGTVQPHSPQVGIGACNATIDMRAITKLPIAGQPGIESVESA